MINPNVRNRIVVGLSEKKGEGGSSYVNAEFKIQIFGRGDVKFSLPCELLREMIEQCREAREKYDEMADVGRWRVASGDERQLMAIERSCQCQLRTLLQDNLTEAMMYHDENGVVKMSYSVVIKPIPANCYKIETKVSYQKTVKASLDDEVGDPDAPVQTEMDLDEEDMACGWSGNSGVVIDVESGVALLGNTPVSAPASLSFALPSPEEDDSDGSTSEDDSDHDGDE